MQYQNYILPLILFLVLLIIIKIISFITEKYLKKLFKKTKTQIDDLLLKKLSKPIFYTLILFAAKISIYKTTFESTLINKILNTFIIILLTIIIIRLVGIFITLWLKKFSEKTETTLDDELLPIFHKIANLIILILSVIYILSQWNIEVGPLLASLGIAGVAIGFALKDTLSNMFAGFTIIFDKYFKINDLIQLESGEKGKVLDIGIRSTKIRTVDNEIIIVPNNEIANAKVINFAKPDPKARVPISVSVSYNSDIDKVKKILLDCVKKLQKQENSILKKPEPKVYFTEMADFSLNFKLVFWLKSYKKRFKIKDKINTLIFNTLKKERIEIPFPTRTIYTKKTL